MATISSRVGSVLAASVEKSVRAHPESWLAQIDLDPRAYRTHSLRRTKASLIYWRTKNLCAVQLLQGHANIASTVRYLGIKVDDALEPAEQTEI